MSTESDTHLKPLERRLFEVAAEPMAIVSADGRVHRVNRAACDYAGVGEAEFLAAPFWERLHPGDHEAAARMLAALPEAERNAASIRARVVRPDGSCRWFEARVVLDPDTGLIYAIAHDRTERDLDDLEHVIHSFRDAPIGMALIGPDGAFLHVNETLCRMVGRAEGRLTGIPVQHVLEEGDPSVELFADEALRSGAHPSFQVEARLRRPDGLPAVALVTATLVRDPRGEPRYYICQILDITQRHQAQERLANNEAKLAEAQQIARLGSWEWEIAGDRVTWSDELYRIYGVRPDRFPGSYGSYLDKIHADDRARVARVIEAAVAERRGWSLDYRIMRSDGELRMIQARGEVVTDAQGRPAVVRGTCQDVTENRRVEDALRAAEQLFRRAFDDAPIGMALIDLEGRWLRLNRSIGRMLGRTEQELRGMRLAELSHPDDRDIDVPLNRELLAGRRRSYAVEKRYVHADGRMVHVLVHVSLMHGDGERPLYFLCQLVDITERRRAEAERRAGEERLQAIIDNSPALIFVKDLEHRYLLVNQRWQELFGLPAEQVIGRTSEDVMTQDRVSDGSPLEREVVATGRPHEEMVTLPGEDGEDGGTFFVLKFPLRDADGRIYAVCSIATDMTERRRDAEVRAELEQRLAQAQRLESVGQLAGGVAHDFNNLLSVILTCVGFAARELPADHPVRDDVEEIGRAADRAAALTRQLLMFSRREVVKPEVLDAGALVRDLERLLNRTLSERIALRISCGPGIVPILADRAQLEQVLVNLAVNARDAMPDGGTLAIAVSGARTKGDEEGVLITVADDGMGMDPDVVERAFEPFFTTKDVGEGTGLGLATVHGIVVDSGGTVDIDSTPGEGTVVSIFLPRADVPLPAPDEPDEPRERAADGASVMVVEDQDPVRRQACRILEAHGYMVSDAPAADQALERWEPVDVLVTDVVMPGMSGQELAVEARRRNPELRVVFMSGHTEDVLLRNGARQGDIAFVHKPFTRDSLLQAVGAALADAAVTAPVKR